MPLTQHQEKRLVDWCTSHSIRATCPMCGRNDWSTGEIIHAGAAASSADGDAPAGSQMIQIICDHCRLVMLFDGGVIEESRGPG